MSIWYHTDFYYNGGTMLLLNGSNTRTGRYCFSPEPDVDFTCVKFHRTDRPVTYFTMLSKFTVVFLSYRNVILLAMASLRLRTNLKNLLKFFIVFYCTCACCKMISTNNKNNLWKYFI